MTKKENARTFSGANLRSLRESKKWSRGVLAHEYNARSSRVIGSDWIYKWEEKGVVPGSDHLPALASALECSIDDFFAEPVDRMTQSTISDKGRASRSS